MAGDFPIGEIYDEALRKLGERRAEADKASKAAFEGLNRQTGTAYGALDNEAYVNKALTERAFGTAGDSMATIKQRRESGLKNTLGKNARQRKGFEESVDLVLQSYETRNAAEDAALTARYGAAKDDALVSQARFDKTLGLKQKQLELDKQNSRFSNSLAMYTKRLLDNEQFKDITGYEVKKLKRRSAAINTANVSGILRDASAAANESQHAAFRDIPEDNNNGDSTSGTIGMTTAEVLEANREEYIEEYGAREYSIASAYVWAADTGRIVTDYSLTGVDSIQGLIGFIDNLDANVSELGEDGCFDRINTLMLSAQNEFNTAIEDKYEEYPDAVSWNYMEEVYPEIASQFGYTDSQEDKEREWLGLSPAAFTPEAYAEELREIWAEEAFSQFGDGTNFESIGTKRSTMMQALNVDLSDLSTYEILCISVYVESTINPEMNLENTPVITARYGILKKLLNDGEEIYNAYTRPQEVTNQLTTFENSNGGGGGSFSQFESETQRNAYEQWQQRTGYQPPTGRLGAVPDEFYQSDEYKNALEQDADMAYDYYTGTGAYESSPVWTTEEGGIGFGFNPEEIQRIEENNTSLDQATIEYLRVYSIPELEEQYFPDGLDRNEVFYRLEDHVYGAVTPAADTPLGEVASPDQLADRLTLGLWTPRSSEGPQLTEAEAAFFAAARRSVFRSQYIENTELQQEAKDHNAFVTISETMTDSFFRPIVSTMGAITNAVGLNESGRDFGGEISADIDYKSLLLPYTEGYQPWMAPVASAGQSIASIGGSILVGMGISSGLGALSELLGTSIAVDPTLLSNPALRDASLLGKLAPNDLLKGMLVTQFDESYRKYKESADSDVDAIMSATVEAIGMTFIEGLGGIGAASGEAVAAGISSTPKTVIKRIFDAAFEIGEEIGEESLQALLQGGIESITEGTPLIETGSMQQFSSENILETSAAVALTTLLFYLIGLPIDIQNQQYQIKAQALLDNVATAIQNNDVAALKKLGVETSNLASEALSSGRISVDDAKNIELLAGQLNADAQSRQAKNGEITVPELLETGTISEAGTVSIESETKLQRAVQASIEENIQNNPEGVQAALTQGMTTLIGIEARLKRDSGNINYESIDISASHNSYMDFSTERGTVADSAVKAAKLGIAAQAMAGDIRTVVESGQLSMGEVSQLQGVMEGLTGDVGLAEVYVGQMAEGVEVGIVSDGVDGANFPNMDVEGENGYNEGGNKVGEAVEKQHLADKIAQEYNSKYNPAERAKNKGYEGIGTTANGGVTFEGTKYMYPVEEGQLNRITIQAQGTRTGDFNMANSKAGLDATPDNAVWHHLDDYNVINGEITLELVYKDAHKATVPHAGSCAQYDAVHGPSYNK